MQENYIQRGTQDYLILNISLAVLLCSKPPDKCTNGDILVEKS